jgi:predicted permease
VRSLLVASQAAIAIIVLAAAVLLTRSLSKLEQIALGYNADHLAFLSVSWPALKLEPGPKLYPMGEELTRRWSAIPGIVAVTPTVVQPMLGASVFISKMDWEGQSPEERATNAWIPWEEGGEGYFRALGIPVRHGRGFADSDREDAPLVVVVGEAVARRAWPGADAIGKRVKFFGDSAWRTVVGVVGDVHLRTLRESTPELYVPWRQAGFFQNNFAVRTAGSLASVLPALRRELRAVDPALTLWYVTPMRTLLDTPLAKPRMTTLLMSGFGAAALLLAALGLYGLMASVVREGTREIGIRMALGATPERVRRSVLSHALITCGIGAAVGIGGALALSRLLASQLYDVRPSDPVALIGACVILLAVALIAAYLPARRATRIDPAQALRAD